MYIVYSIYGDCDKHVFLIKNTNYMMALIRPDSNSVSTIAVKVIMAWLL